MYQIMSLGNEPKQEIIMMINSRARIVLNFEYKANQLGWFFGFKYKDINYQNIRLTTSFNILRAYRNYLPFGLRCDTVDNNEPTNINDFINGYAKVYLLEQNDVEAIEGIYYQKVE